MFKRRRPAPPTHPGYQLCYGDLPEDLRFKDTTAGWWIPGIESDEVYAALDPESEREDLQVAGDGPTVPAAVLAAQMWAEQVIRRYTDYEVTGWLPGTDPSDAYVPRLVQRCAVLRIIQPGRPPLVYHTSTLAEAESIVSGFRNNLGGTVDLWLSPAETLHLRGVISIHHTRVTRPVPAPSGLPPRR